MRALGLTFRDAHHITGKLVKIAEDNGTTLEALELTDMQSVEAGITAEVYDVLGVENSVSSRVSYGGTAPEIVRQAVKQAQQRFLG